MTLDSRDLYDDFYDKSYDSLYDAKYIGRFRCHKQNGQDQNKKHASAPGAAQVVQVHDFLRGG